MPVFSTLALVAASLNPAPAAAPAATAVIQRAPVVGGFRPVEASDEGVRAAASYAATELGSELGRIITAERQIVAGRNYRILFEAANGRRWRVLVHQPLQGELQLRHHEPVQAPAE